MQVQGLNSVPRAGDTFIVTDEDRLARQIAEKREAAERNAQLAKARKRISLEDFTRALEEGKVESLNLIIKGDVSGAVEALEESLLKIEVDDSVQLRIIHRGVGAITESDVNLATIDNAIIIGFNVRPDTKARERASREGVDTRFYSVIYNAIDDVEQSLKGMLKPEFEEVQSGVAEIREVFRSSKFGNIAGVIVRSRHDHAQREGARHPRWRRRRRWPGHRVAASLQGRRHRGAHGLRGRYRPRQVQRHPDRRRDRDHRARREAARLDPLRSECALPGGVRSLRRPVTSLAWRGGDNGSERQARLRDRIRVILAERLEKGLRDPRLGFVTITDVQGDRRPAARVGVLHRARRRGGARSRPAEALKSATGMLRSEVGKHLNVRLTPSLEFIPDAIPENADHIATLLREARERDEAVAGLASSAQLRRRCRPVRQAARVRRGRPTTRRDGAADEDDLSAPSAELRSRERTIPEDRPSFLLFSEAREPQACGSARPCRSAR